jgi:glycosyltransferase involved in cell wall biosynthesis
MPTPILILSDAPDSDTGLGRITRDLATILATMPEFRVATMGRGGMGSRKLPWAQYTFPENKQWGEDYLIKACQDFSCDDPFIIFTIWDASRLFWFGYPATLPSNHPLKAFLESGDFKRWGYFPIDAEGPNHGLSVLSRRAISGYDRLLAYTRFGREVINASGVDWEPDFIPHGIHQDTFCDKGRDAGRTVLGVNPEHKLVGCVMTNQARKDWGTWAQMAASLVELDKNYHFWVHVDLLERYWSLPALIEDFGLSEHVHITNSLSDDSMATLYSACDVTVLPSLGEGFGYPLAESMACGVPAIHVAYGGGAEVTPLNTQPGKFRLDTLNNVFRPFLEPNEFAYYVHQVIEKGLDRVETRKQVEHLFWPNLTPVWKNWFLKGLR